MKVQIHSLLLLLFLISAWSFVPSSRIDQHAGTESFRVAFHADKSAKKSLLAKIQRQRKSLAPIQTMGLFGLGGLEIAVIVIGVGVVLGPEKIVDMVRSSGSTANEFKEELAKVPDEFKKGMEEGEMEVRSRKARPIKKVVVKDDEAE